MPIIKKLINKLSLISRFSHYLKMVFTYNQGIRNYTKNPVENIELESYNRERGKDIKGGIIFGTAEADPFAGIFNKEDYDIHIQMASDIDASFFFYFPFFFFSASFMMIFFYFFGGRFEKFYISFMNTKVMKSYSEKSHKISTSFIVSGLFLLFYKLLFYFIAGYYSPYYLNLSILISATIISYYFELYIKVKRILFIYFISVVLPFNSRQWAQILTVYDEHLDIDYITVENTEKSIKSCLEDKRLNVERFFSFFVLIRLFFLAEPFLYLLSRITLVYLLIFNGFYFISIFIN